MTLETDWQTLNGSWGHDRDNLAYKSADLLIQVLVDECRRTATCC